MTTKNIVQKCMLLIIASTGVFIIVATVLLLLCLSPQAKAHTDSELVLKHCGERYYDYLTIAQTYAKHRSLDNVWKSPHRIHDRYDGSNDLRTMQMIAARIKNSLDQYLTVKSTLFTKQLPALLAHEMYAECIHNFFYVDFEKTLIK